MSLFDNLDIIQLIFTISVVSIPLILSMIKKHNFSEIVFSENVRMIRFVISSLIKSIIFSTMIVFFIIVNEISVLNNLMSSNTEVNSSLMIIISNFVIGLFVSSFVLGRLIRFIFKEHFFGLLIESTKLFITGIKTKGFENKRNKSRIERTWYAYGIRFVMIPVLLTLLFFGYIFRGSPLLESVYSNNSVVMMQLLIIFYLFVVFLGKSYYYNTKSIITINKVYSDFEDIRGKLTFVSIDKDKTYLVNKNNDRFYILYPNSGKVYEYKIEDVESRTEYNQELLKKLKSLNLKHSVK